MSVIKNKLQRVKKFLSHWFNRGEAIITIIIVLGILIVVNFFSTQFFTRVDLTENQIYSISEVSKNTLTQIDDAIRIEIYFSDNVPTNYVVLKERVRDILSEYETYGSGKVSLNYINPATIEEAQTKLARMGIPQLRFNVLQEGSYQVTAGYMGMAFKYRDKTEVIPVIRDARNLEYQFTTAIKKLTQDETPKLGILTSHGSLASDPDDFETAQEKLQEIYDLELINLEESIIPEEIKTLLVPGPTTEFAQSELEELDTFLMRGGNLIFLVDGAVIKEGLIASQNETNLNDLLESYGLRVNKNVVLDVSSGYVSFTSGLYTFQSKYPPWVMVKSENFSQSNVAVSGLETLILPWPASIDLLSEDIAYEALIKTTDRAWTQEEEFSLNPETGFEAGDQEQYTLAVISQGDLPSAFSDELNSEARLVVVGNSSFAKENFLDRDQNNLVLLQNLVDSVALDDDLIQIRSKEIVHRPLRDLTGSAQNIVQYLNIFALSIVVVIFGVLRYYIRKRRI